MNNEIVLHDDNYYYNLIRNNIRRYRKLSNLKQEDLQKLTGFSQTYISIIENKSKESQFTIPTICKIIDALGISIDDVFTFNPNFIKTNSKIKDKKYYYDRCRNNIKKYRIINDLTQQELANMIGLTRDFISQIETQGKSFSLATIGRISDALDVPIENFFKD